LEEYGVEDNSFMALVQGDIVGTCGTGFILPESV
jgi:hypothetical protein